MKYIVRISLFAAAVFAVWSCQDNQEKKKQENAGKTDTVATKTGDAIDLPAPYATKSVANFTKVTGWGDKKPAAPAGFAVVHFATKLNNPRWIYVAPNGDIFVSEANGQANVMKQAKNLISGKSKSGNDNLSPDKIILFRDNNNDGQADFQSEFLTDLNQPFGMLVIGKSFYVANTDGVWQYPYQPGEHKIKSKGKKILELPAGGYNNHWTRNIITNKDSSKIYVTVGSASNVAEHGMETEVRRANILEINPDGSGEIIYASGLRNPQGMAWAPGTQELWTSVNERDELGDELVPDYMTGVKKGGFYGWPFAYFGKHEDPRRKNENPAMVSKSIVPDVPLGAHTASLGLAFESRSSWPGKYSGGAFIGQHGSWNSSKPVGYRVAFVPFKNGKPAGAVETFLGGFLEEGESNKAHGRPVGVAFTKNETMLVADDASNTIWAVMPAKS